VYEKSFVVGTDLILQYSSKVYQMQGAVKEKGGGVAAPVLPQALQLTSPVLNHIESQQPPA
jgi:hypothetical protein